MNLSEQVNKVISDLAGSKYRSWEWIYGWSPDYELNSDFQFQESGLPDLFKSTQGFAGGLRA